MHGKESDLYMPARKAQGGIKNTISAKTKRKATPWLANAVKSIGLSYSEVFKEISPNIYDIANTSAKSVNQLARSARNANIGNVTNALNNNRYVKAGQNLIKNTIADLKTGTFNNTARADEAMADSFDLGDFESGTFFDDWDFEDGGSAVQINNYSDSAGFSLAIDDSMKRSTEAQLKGQKASIDTMIAISSAQMMQQQQLNSEIIGHLGNISNGINALVEFNNSTLASFIESSTAYMEKLGGKIEEMSSYNSDKIDPQSVYRDRNGGINASNYIQFVKQNIKSTMKNSNAGFLADMLDDNMLNLLTANPLGAISTMALKQITPKMIKNSLSALDETLAGFIPTMFAKIADMADDPSFGIGGSIRRSLGKIFGVKIKRTNEFDMENKITDKAVPFDQITRHAITEVIPKYLREQTAYLEAIARNLGVNTKASKNNAEVFDYRRGYYRSLRDVKEDIYGDIRNTTISKMENSRFGSALRDKAIGSQSDQEAFQRMLDNFFVALEKHGKFLNITDQSKGSDLDKIIRSLGYNPNMSNHLRAALKSVTSDPTIALNANTAIQQAILSRNSLIKDMTDDPTSYNLYAADIGNTIDSGIREVFKTSIGDPEKTKTGTLNDIMNDVRFLLNRGINVKIMGHGSYNSIDKGGSSRTNTTSSNTINTSSSSSGEKSIYDKKNLSEADIERMMNDESLDTIFGGNGQDKSKVVTGLQNFMSALAFGSGQQAFQELVNIAGSEFSKIGKKFSDEFIAPIKKSVFGDKDKDGYLRDGLFSGMQNKFIDTYRAFAREFTGKGYTDSHGNKIANKKDDEETVIGNLKNFTHNTLDIIGDYILGEKIYSRDENGNVVWKGKRDKSKGNWLGKAIGTIQEGFKGWTDAIFGEEMNEENKKKTLADIKRKVSDTLPSTITGAVGGIAFNTLAGSSLLGTIIGGPMGGALLGAAAGTLSKSDRFNKWLFGEDFVDEDGNPQHIEGLISKRVQDAFKNNKTAIVGGAALGLGKTMIFGSGGGLLTSLVGGPFAGAIIGGSLSFIKNTDMFQKFLYGDADEGGWHKGVVNMFNGIFRNSETGEVSGRKLAGMNIIGALGGGLTAAMVGQMGLLGAAVTPFGPIGGALAGLALSMKASKKGFHEFLFGRDETDEEGNTRHKVGVLGKFANMLDAEVFAPMKAGMENFIDDSKDFLIDKLMAPVEFALEPLALTLKRVGEGIQTKIMNGVDAVTDMVKSRVDKVLNTVRDIIVKPIRNVFSIFFKGITGIAKTIIATPFQGLALATNFMDARAKRDSRKQVMRENRQNQGFLRGTLSNMAIRFRYGDAYEDASHRYVDYEQYENSRSERQRRYDEDRANRLAENQRRKDARRYGVKNRQLIARVTGNLYDKDTEENRAIAQQMWEEELARMSPLRRAFANETLNFKGVASDEENERKKKLKNKLTVKDLVSGADKDDTSLERKRTGYTIKTYDAVNEIKSGVEKINENLKKSGELVGKTLADALKEMPDINGEGDGESLVAKAKSRITDAFGNILPGHARGGTAKGGPVIVGENGPEVVYLPDGTKVKPNAKSANEIARKEAAADYEDLKKKGSYETQMKEKEQEQEKKYKNSVLTILKDTKEILSEYTGGWKGIFGKKGLITAAIVMLAPLAIKLINKLLNTDLAQIIKDALGLLGDTAGRVADDFAYGQEHLGDNKNSLDKLEENIDETQSLLQGDVLGWIAPGGELDHQSGAKVNVLAHIPSYLKAGANWLKKSGVGQLASGLKNGVTGIAKGVVKGASGIKNAATGVKNAVSIIKSGSAKDILNSAKSFKSSGYASTWKQAIGMGAENAGVTLKASGDDIAETVAKNSDGIVGLVKKCFTKVVDKIGAILQKYSKNGSKLAKYVDDIGKFVSKHTGKIANKLSPLLSKTAALASTGIGLLANEGVMITVGAINGATGPARLFQVDNEYVDGWMRAISTAIGGFTGSTIGSVVDIVNELAVDILGIDLLHEIACTAYQILAGDVKYDKLIEGKNEFRADFEANEANEWNTEYQNYLADNGLTEADMSMDQFRAEADAGNISVNITSFADYNDQQHQTLGSRIMGGVSTVGKGISGIGKGIVGGVKNTASGIATGARNLAGGIATGAKNLASGAKNVITGIGTGARNLAGGIASGAKNLAGGIASGARNLATGAKNVVTGIGTKVGDVASGIASGIGNGLSTVGNAIGNIKDYVVEAFEGYTKGIKEIIANFKDTDNSLFDYLKADIDTGMSDDNPFRGLVSGMLTVGKVTMLPKLIIFGILGKIGNKVKETFTNVADVAVTSAKTVITTVDQFKQYAAKGDVEGLNKVTIPDDEENPLNGVLHGVLGVARLLNVPVAYLFKIGAKVKDSFISMVDGVRSIFSTATQNLSSMASFALSGDTDGLSNYQISIPENTPLSGILSGVMNGAKLVWQIPAHIVGFGKGVAEKVRDVVDTAKGVGTDIGTNVKNMVGYISQGDIEGLDEYEMQKSSDGILGWLIDTTGGLAKNIIRVPTSVVSLGKSVKEFVGNTLDTAKGVGTDIGTNVKNMVNFISEGDVEGLDEYEMQKSSEGILGWLIDTTGGVAKNIIRIPTSVVSLGKSVKEFVGGALNKVSDIKEDIKNYIKDANEFTDPDKKMDGFKNIKFGTDENDPISNIVGSVLSRIMYVYVNIMRGINSVGDFIGDKVEWVKDTAGNLKEGASNALSTAGNAVTGAIDSIGTAIMNFGRGGKGGRGGNIDLPYFSQNDPRWRNASYGDETFGEAGCGPDAMAMVASGLGGGRSGVTPMEMADYARSKGFRDSSGTNWNFIDSASRDYGLTSQRQYRPNESFISSQLDQGHPVILSGQGGPNTPYTRGGHYVVATGKDSSGNVTISDPRGRNYSGKYSLSSVANNANIGWGISRGGRGPSDESDLVKAREAVVKTMMALQGKLKYSQGSDRSTVLQALTKGSAAGDCSSTCQQVYKQATGIDIGGYTGAQINNKNGTDVDNTPGCPDESHLLPGDLLFFKGSGSGVGHVEMYIGNGQLMGHGGPGNGPTVKNMREYCQNRASRNKGYMKARRWILSSNSIKVTLPSAVNTILSSNGISTTASTSSSGSSSVLNTVSNFFTQFGEKAFNGILTGNWDSNYNWDSSSSSSDSSSGSSDYSVQTINLNGNTNGEKIWNYLIGKGLSPQGVAGLMGNLYQESGLSPNNLQNSYETSLGHTDTSYTSAVDSGSYTNFARDKAGYGLAQWTTSGRKAALLNYKNQSGTSIGDLGMQLGFLSQELEKDYPTVWDTLNNTNSIQAASDMVLTKFERPKDQSQNMKNKRANFGQQIFNQYGGAKKTAETISPDTIKAGLRGGSGGRGTGKNRAFKSFGNSSYGRSYSSYQSYGGRGENDTIMIELMRTMIGLLQTISNASVSSDKKLDLLNNVGAKQVDVTSVNMGGRGNKTQPIIVTSNGEQVISAPSRNSQIAKKIALGF